ncbi:glycosyltransferase [Geodermatophilus sp. SYSU D00703]
MRIFFAYWLLEDGGSAQDLRAYVTAAPSLGHEVFLYGPPGSSPGIPCSLDVGSADFVVFVFEWTTQIGALDGLHLTRILAQVPRERRIVIDCDGGYNSALSVDGDRNHRDAQDAREWVEVCDRISDRIFQPTLHPLRPGVSTFFFHGYDPAWERPFDFTGKDHGMVYVGHSKFRWGPMRRVLGAVEPVRSSVGRISLVGHGWDAMPSWAADMAMEDAYATDLDYLDRLEVECVPPVRSDEVLRWMGRAVFNPVIYRPLFSHLQFVTCRTFETPAAGTIPLFGLDEAYVSEVFGEAATALVLPDHAPEDLVADLVSRPEHYQAVVSQIRSHLARRHSYRARVDELIRILVGDPRAPVPA